jgi:hypothetical protein
LNACENRRNPCVEIPPRRSFYRTRQTLADPQVRGAGAGLKKTQAPRLRQQCRQTPRDRPRRHATITDADLRLLARSRRWKAFTLSDSKITDAAAEHFGGLNKLTWAWLMETHVWRSHRRGARLASPRLRDLNLCETASPTAAWLIWRG